MNKPFHHFQNNVLICAAHIGENSNKITKSLIQDKVLSATILCVYSALYVLHILSHVTSFSKELACTIAT